MHALCHQIVTYDLWTWAIDGRGFHSDSAVQVGCLGCLVKADLNLLSRAACPLWGLLYGNVLRATTLRWAVHDPVCVRMRCNLGLTLLVACLHK